MLLALPFFQQNPFGCYGDGGAIFTNDDDLASKLKSIRVHGGGEDKYNNIRIGINGRLDSIQAAILLEKIKIFDNELKLRNSAANYYTQNINKMFSRFNYRYYKFFCLDINLPLILYFSCLFCNIF